MTDANHVATDANLWQRWGRQTIAATLSVSLALMLAEYANGFFHPILYPIFPAYPVFERLTFAWFAAALLFSFTRGALPLYLIFTATIWGTAYFIIARYAYLWIYVWSDHFQFEWTYIARRPIEQGLFPILALIITNAILLVRKERLGAVITYNLMILAAVVFIASQQGESSLLDCTGELSPTEAEVCAEESALD